MSELDDLTAAATLAADGTPAGARAAIDALPWLDRAVNDDRASGRFAAWGPSTVIDENTGTAVIARPLFEELHRRAGLAATWPIGNAGLMHCYGYLLSLEVTPYGLKRDRWVEGALAHACGLTADAFHPWHEGPTLLARATAAASAVLAHPAASATAEIDGRETRLALSSEAGSAALTYAVAPTPGGAHLLVTMFPVAEASAPRTEFTAAPRLRWNAV
ncbi:amino acid deaminase [Microbacterium sp. NPDC008134]|uniref:amino acid deaminase n=1 Tax=Microbacterium sp. NPDC008134 TaxID=3364183 RepID=UPI0036EF9C38